MKKAMVTDVAFPKKVRLSKKVTINFFFLSWRGRKLKKCLAGGPGNVEALN